MSFDLVRMQSLTQAHGAVARVVVARTAGSVPRGPGAAMVVWATGQDGTIGGGALEHEAAARARRALQTGDRLDKVPLGPGLGQCCGGAVTLLTEIWDQDRVAQITDIVARPLPGAQSPPNAPPLKVQNRLRAARSGARPLTAAILDGWMVEPVCAPTRDLWLWGAGHVGRAIVGVLAPLPDWRITWLDTGRDRFPPDTDAALVCRADPAPQTLVGAAPPQAHHLIVTYSHALDLELCHRLLGRPTGSIGLIGSATKWARFRNRLTALGHTDTHRIVCPIGDPSLGKHPQAIALGVVSALVRDRGVAALPQTAQA